MTNKSIIVQVNGATLSLRHHTGTDNGDTDPPNSILFSGDPLHLDEGHSVEVHAYHVGH